MAADSRFPTRLTYRHGDLRRALLDAGVALAREGGPDAVVLREATRRAGVAPNAAYRHFANRQALLDAVREQALVAMSSAMEAEMARAEQPGLSAAARAHALLRAVGTGYLRFARAETGLFLTAFAGKAFRELDVQAAPPLPTGQRDPFQLLSSALDAMVAAGVMPARERPGAEFLAWSTVHGMAFLLIDGPLAAADETQIGPLGERLLRMVERGLSVVPEGHPVTGAGQ